VSTNRSWSAYPNTYCAAEMQQLARWIQTNSSGSVVGLAGAGKSNLLGFLCHRPDALQNYLAPSDKSVALIPVDLNNLPANNLATLYRVILRSFYEVQHQFETPLQETITALYHDHRSTRDAFLAQSALRELLLLFQAHQMRVVLVLDRFDKFCRQATLPMTDTMRGLRDSFKDTLSYIAGMRQEVVYLSDPTVLGELYELLDTHVCWVGSMDEADARRLIADETLLAATPPTEADIRSFLNLSGGHPALLKVTCHWWLAGPDRPHQEWTEVLLAERTIQYRIKELWNGLSQEEQRVLSEVQALAARSRGRKRGDNLQASQELYRQQKPVLDHLAAKGIGQPSKRGWQISSLLLAAYIALVGGRSRGKLWFDQRLNLIYQGQTSLDNLSPLENSLLKFLVSHPHVRHTYTDLIEAAWPEDIHLEGVSTEALYQLVRGLRRQIEPTPSQPRYIVNWRGRPEGGYQCFPEGRPG
jgi:hypothetical protein